MKNVFIGRQPIIDKNENLFAHDILYRDANKKVQVQDRHTSASVISNVLNRFGTGLLGKRRGFVRIDEKFLLNDIIFSIPSEFFVFALISRISMSERVVERVQQLHEKGYSLAINNIELNEESLERYRPILTELSFVKSNVIAEISIFTGDVVRELRSHNIKIVATKITDQDTFAYAKELGCDYFEGYYFAEPKILENAKYEPTQMNVLKLYNLLMQDVNIDEITAEFEKNPEITVQLLQFINSGYFHFRNRISTIHHVLTLVGRIAIGQWLMLMIYSKSVSKNSEKSPLMLMVMNRTKLMEKILKAIKPDVRSNDLGEAYMVGVLSLVPALFGMELKSILDSINISDAVRDALCEGEGILGEIYSIVKNSENFEIKAIYAFETKYKIKHQTIENLVLESMQELQQFENQEKE